MAISEEDVRKIAQLAHLRLASEEVQLYQGQLVKILDSMTELSTLDTSAVLPTTSVLGLSNVMREDVPAPFPGIEALLANAPDSEGGYFKVRKVIE